MSSPVVNIAILGAGRQAYVHAAAIVSVGAPAWFYASYDLFQSASEKLSASHAHAPKVAASIEEVLAGEILPPDSKRGPADAMTLLLRPQRPRHCRLHSEQHARGTCYQGRRRRKRYGAPWSSGRRVTADTAFAACLCEKPLDTELAAIEKLRSALKELEKTQKLPYIAVGFPKRHDPSFVRWSFRMQP